MGEKTLDVDLLKSMTTIEGNHEDDGRTESWFWEVLREMTEEDKRKYWKFVNGASRLSLSFREQGDPHIVYLEGYSLDEFPKSHTW